MTQDYASAVLSTPVGAVSVVASAHGIRQVSFGSDQRDAPGSGAPARLLRQARAELAEYFEGRRQVFEVPLDWELSSGWALAVRRKLFEAVGYGATVGYGTLAALAGRPDGARAVGGIMAGNPIPLIVPCHRVIAADGGLGGFAGSGGTQIETKRRLLQLEGSAAPTLF